MSEIIPNKRSVEELLRGKEYYLDYYQREFVWGKENIEDLINDLTSKFLNEYQDGHESRDARGYEHYFLGTILLCDRNNRTYVVDGQQRITSLTLLLIYLNHLQNLPSNVDGPPINIENMILSDTYGKLTNNINDDERNECMRALFQEGDFVPTDSPPSVHNIISRYKEIENIFPEEELKEAALKPFIYWLISNVDLVEIKAFSDDDAYEIFEVMNDRGVGLTSTEMLKGYLLSKAPEDQRAELNEIWKNRIIELNGHESDFFKSWLRAQYAKSIRERSRGAENKDFELIGTKFHNWVKESKDMIDLQNPSDFYNFINDSFDKYSKIYLKILEAQNQIVEDLEYVHYNSINSFTLQPALILSAICPDDEEAVIKEKMRLVSGFIDIFIARRVVNYRTLGYSSIVYTMFKLMTDLRDKETQEISEILKERLAEIDKEGTTFEAINSFSLHNQNKRKIHILLARMTNHIEKKSGMESQFNDYIPSNIPNPFQVEHIWADKFERHEDEFPSQGEFESYRDRFGGLLLLPSNFNQSLNADTYEEKLRVYYSQNLLARTLNDQCYSNNPGFLRYKDENELPFIPHPEFKKADLDARQNLYRKLCEEIWHPDRLNSEQ